MRRVVPNLKQTVVLSAALAFGYSVYIYLTLPDVRSLGSTNPKTTAFIELRAREARRRGLEPRRIQHWVRYGRISPHLTKAVLVAEDGKFWRHEGVDFDQIRESMEVNIERLEFARGASTITQQLAKNLYLSPTKNPVRKIRELLIARRLEAELTKQRILELYLNVIEWGDGVYGAEAAARAHFGKAAAQLGRQEAALLAGALVNPRLLNPGRPTSRLLRRQEMILRRMGAVLPPAPLADSSSSLAAEEPSDQPLPAAPGLRTPTVLPGDPAPLPPVPVEPCGKPDCR